MKTLKIAAAALCITTLIGATVAEAAPRSGWRNWRPAGQQRTYYRSGYRTVAPGVETPVQTYSAPGSSSRSTPAWALQKTDPNKLRTHNR